MASAEPHDSSRTLEPAQAAAGAPEQAGGDPAGGLAGGQEPSASQLAAQQQQQQLSSFHQAGDQREQEEEEQQQQSASATANIERQAAALLRKLEMAASTSKKLSNSDLQPEITAWLKQCDKVIKELMACFVALQQLPAQAAACQRDVQVLLAALSKVPPDQPGIRSVLEAAMRGAQQFSYQGLVPQALLLLANPESKWQAACTAALTADKQFAPYFTVTQRAFQQALVRQKGLQAEGDLRRAAAKLPTLDDVVLRQDQLPTAAGGTLAATSTKTLPPSKAKRKQLQQIWAWLLACILKPQGESVRAGWT